MYNIKNIINERLAQKITETKLAKYLNITLQAYCNYETQVDVFPIKHLIKVCDYLNISLDYGLNLTSKKRYNNEKKVIDKNISGLRLKEFRKNLKLTQSEFGEILNCSYGTIAGYEKGRYTIATPFLYQISKKYYISADYLLGRIDSPKYLA